MKKILLALVFSLFLISCENSVTTQSTYTPLKITAETGKTMMDANNEIILVDVRTYDEYITYHIPGALLLPVDDIQADALTLLSDQSKVYIIYCNSGNRSADAANQLSLLGYPFIYDMGGIIDWPYETVAGE